MFRSRGNIKGNTNILKEILYEDNKPIQHIGAIKSCIEADEASYLLKILKLIIESRQRRAMLYLRCLIAGI
jgi:hypothetical protein